MIVYKIIKKNNLLQMNLDKLSMLTLIIKYNNTYQNNSHDKYYQFINYNNS